MAEIKAFVAHSFRAEDKELVQVFIDYFNTLAGLLPEFSWDHAQQAEPTSVSSKVLAKIAGKTVFIGICGKSERVMLSDASFRLPFLNLVRFKAADAQWKTSDWIIQEIGLAVGRQMKVIIFLEDDVREPGGLFGDIEYIRFARANPHASFDKLLQMLGALTPRSAADVIAVEARPVTANKPKDEDENISSLEPQLSWDQSDYDQAAFTAIVAREDVDVMSKIDAAYRDSPLSKGGALAVWEARNEWLRMLGDQKGDFDKIKSAVNEDPHNTTLLTYLADGYSWYGEHLHAARVFEDASGYSTSAPDKAHFLTRAAEQYALADQKDRADEIIEKAKFIAFSNPEVTLGLLSSLKIQGEAENDDQLQLAAMEEIVSLSPTDTSARFALAYKHSQSGNTDMALYHYKKIPAFARDSTTWNNIGVSYGEFRMRAKSIAAFRRSAKENETLAMSNLGFALLNAGFLKEAQQEADKAIAIKSYHENVNELLKRLKEVPAEEKEKLKEALDKVKEKAAFYRKAGVAVLKTTPSNVPAKWNSPDCTLEAKVDGVSLRIAGTYQRPYGGIAGLIGLPAAGLGQTMVAETIEYAGRMRGNFVVGTVKRSNTGAPQGLLAVGGSNTKLIMVFNDDYTELLVAERPDSPTPHFYTLTRSTSK